MALTRVKPGGWVSGERLTHTQMNDLDNNAVAESVRLDDEIADRIAGDAALVAADLLKVTSKNASYQIATSTAYAIDDPLGLTAIQVDSGYVLTGGNTVEVPSAGWYLVTAVLGYTMSGGGTKGGVRIVTGATSQLRIYGTDSGVSCSGPVYITTPSTQKLQLLSYQGSGTLTTTSSTSASRVGIVKLST